MLHGTSPPARAPTVGMDHVGSDDSFIDKYEASGVEQSSSVGASSRFAREDLVGVLLQWRSASRHRFASPVLVRALHPPDSGTDADVEVFSRFMSGTSCINKVDSKLMTAFSIRSDTVHALADSPKNQCVTPACLLPLGNPGSLRSGHAVVRNHSTAGNDRPPRLPPMDRQVETHDPQSAASAG
jgi:hypothetical protein